MCKSELFATKRPPFTVVVAATVVAAAVVAAAVVEPVGEAAAVVVTSYKRLHSSKFFLSKFKFLKSLLNQKCDLQNS